jgi:group I intron endonuclease
MNQFQTLDHVQGIYAIRHIESGRMYIGSAFDGDTRHSGVGRRLRQHLWHLDNKSHHNEYLQRAYDKYGREAFELILLEEVVDDDRLIEREQHWLDSNTEVRYNLAPVAGGTSGYRWSEESKAAVSGENHHFYGHTHTEESKRKISENRKGLTAKEKHHLWGTGHTEETCKKMSESHKLLIGDKNPFYGKSHSEETKTKIGLAKLKNAPKGKFKGVLPQGKKYIAYTRTGGYVKIGTFDTAESAARAYDDYIVNRFGKDVYLNFPTTIAHD